MRLNAGDQVTFMDSGEVTVKVKGAKAKKMKVGAGELLNVEKGCEMVGVEMLRFRGRLDRLLEKRRPRPQEYRICGEPALQLELPDVVLTEAQRIEAIHEERGRILKAKLAKEAERLRQLG